MDVEPIFAGLNPEQRRAVEAVRGPVCILAGAGSGKTTTITRRIAHQVASGVFAGREILAVTFTDKAAAEMRGRLEALGVAGVTARTFHAAALGQLHALGGDAPQKIVASKALSLRQIGNSLPRPFRFRPAGDLATEVEWAKNRRLTPKTYLGGLEGHAPPIPPDLMKRVFEEYELRKSRAGYADFEDLLESAVRLFDEDPHALAELRERYAAFTVDEYQDVNLLQQTLLDRWLGPRDELCAVGDDYQSIYGFTGATPRYLLALPERFPYAAVVRLEANYRSTPQVLELANRIVPGLGGAEKVLRATRPGGPEPVTQRFDALAEADFVRERIRALVAEGLSYEEIAVLCRTNARLADFEEPFHEARIPFQGAALLAREAARRLLRRLRGEAPSTAVDRTVRVLADEAGWLEHQPDGLGERELVRQADLGRLIALAAEFDDGTRTTADFVADLERRFGTSGAERRGVHLLTLHGAKGLEFEAVFLPHVQEKELPIRQAKTDAELAEERRLLYVGITRAKRHLAITWSGQPSRFLAELGVQTAAPRREAQPEPDDPLYAALKQWRLRRATADELPAYVVFHNTTLAEIAGRRPRDLSELGAVPGVGPSKLERYGEEVLAVLAAA